VPWSGIQIRRNSFKARRNNFKAQRNNFKAERNEIQAPVLAPNDLFSMSYGRSQAKIPPFAAAMTAGMGSLDPSP
jgi:hypothetical protein